MFESADIDININVNVIKNINSNIDFFIVFFSLISQQIYCRLHLANTPHIIRLYSSYYTVILLILYGYTPHIIRLYSSYYTVILLILYGYTPHITLSFDTALFYSTL